MDVQSIIKNLHPLEIRVLRAFEPGTELTAEKLEKELDYKPGHANQAFSWLTGKALVCEIRRDANTFFEITELGRTYASSGTPEEKILKLLQEKGEHSLPEIAAALGLDNKDVGSAFGVLSKEGAVKMNEAKKASFVEMPRDKRYAIVIALIRLASESPSGTINQKTLTQDEILVMGSLAKKRGALDSPFRILERENVIYTLTAEAEDVKKALATAGITGEEIGSLTSAMLKNGNWKKGSFREYNTAIPPARIIQGRTNPYVSFLESVKDKLSSLGFEEFDGPLVETEFWNSDALFMPQFHAARDIHDAYYVKNPTHAKSIEEPWLSNVAAIHENGGDTGSRGWNYSFDKEFTRRLILRSQGTAISAQQLHKAKIPGKYFGIARCFRYDKVDATHLSDFYQTEGIVLGDEVNLKTLLGFLEMFAIEIAGATEVKYVPGYFPFTEPSIEVHIKHPVLGWFELGGSGIFRPEVTKAMGIDVPVLAWGIGIDRMALMALGLNDLRELFSNDIEGVRLRKAKY
ncbi:MAG TPA: phenylalanine--tRNA ligase subunit alpha [Treponemataceae bacterium]|nr:phenylalanine--tRNA ligase subunit alpha [Treponemataceae bacterium]